MVRRNGQVVLVAIVWNETPVLPPDWMAREVSLKTSFGTQPEDWGIALDLIRSGRVTMEPLVSEAASFRWTKYREPSRLYASLPTRSRWW